MNFINQETWNELAYLNTEEKYELIDTLLSEDCLESDWFPNITKRKNNIKILNQEIKEINLLKKKLDFHIKERKKAIEHEKRQIEKLREKK